jgi:hypothetical protein
MQNRCAVVGCSREGRPQICPYDGSRHHHGRIHYDCGYPKHSVAFHEGTWDLICDVHYKVVTEERKTWAREIGALRRMASA